MRKFKKIIGGAAVVAFTAAGIAVPIATAAPATPIAMHYQAHPTG